MIIEELWKDIPGYEGSYQASSLGRIRSVGAYQAKYGDRVVEKRRRGRVLNLCGCRRGYLRVCLGGKKAHHVGALVCETWNGPRIAGTQCAHQDGNPGNNRPENLRWMSPLENNRQKVGHGTSVTISDEVVRDIFIRRRRGEAAKDIAEIYDVHKETIYKIGNRKLRTSATFNL